MTSRLTIEYRGTAFAGWARQPGQRTVQDELERALAVVVGDPAAVALTVAGRTDAGVHAWGQVASYEGPPVRVQAVNALLPDDLAVVDCVEAASAFDARHDATSRAYCYRLLARPARSPHEHDRALHWPRPLDRALLEECARTLVGTHDFTAFTPTETDHVRFTRDVLAARWTGEVPGLIEFWIEADAFMRHMNRVLVGTMLEVAGGRRTLPEFAELLSGRGRWEAGATAPAHGLYLVGIGYEGRRVLPDR